MEKGNTIEVHSSSKDNRQPDLLSRRDAAAYLGITPETLAIWYCTKRYPLPIVKIGRLAKYKRSDLDAFIASRTIA
jgi:hypothetical protein